MSKREREAHSIKDLMQSFIKENNLTKGMQQIQVEEAWHYLMGAGVTSYTESVALQNKTLIVRLSSSVLREELSYGKEKIIQMLNKEMGNNVVTKLLLV